VGPRVGLDDMKKIFDPTETELRTLGRPARSQSLYRLRYPAPLKGAVSSLINSRLVIWHRETCNNCSEGICYSYSFFFQNKIFGLFIRRQFGCTSNFASAVTIRADVGD
jgi:hypothetical protein